MGAAEPSGLLLPTKGDYVIAADGGYNNLISAGITPDLIVGDFDSLSVIPNHPNIIRLPQEKDDTDMMFAVRKGLEYGCDIFFLDGGIGDRFDHSFANMQALNFIAQNGARGYLLGSKCCVTVIKNSSIRFKPGLSGDISVFSFDSVAENVSIEGLKYLIKDGEISNTFPIGVSNEFIGTPATIKTRKGVLVIIWSGGPDFVDISAKE
jgi:thiamine pyrophosphokinase